MFCFYIDDSFTFPGGNAEKLATCLGKATNRPVAIFANPTDRFKQISSFPKSSVTSEVIAKSLKLVTSGSTFNLRTRTLPPGFLCQVYQDDYYQTVQNLATLELRSGKIKVDGRKSCWIRLADLSRLKLSKRLEAHWLYERAFVAVSPGEFKEEELLHAISDALGAIWKPSDQSYEIQFNAKLHRQMARETYASSTWDLPKVGPSGRKRAFELASSFVSDSVWAEAYARPSGSAVQEGIPRNSEVAKAGIDMLYNMVEYTRLSGQKGSYQALLGIFQRIDPNHPARITVTSDGIQFIDFVLDDGTTWTGA